MRFTSPNLDGYPDEYFILVNSTFSDVRNAVTKKFFISPAYQNAIDNPSLKDDYLNGQIDYLPYTKKENKFLSPFAKRVMEEANMEYWGEEIRKNEFPTYASRITGIHAFGDITSCKIACQRHKWNIFELRRFKLHKDEFTRVTKANMNFVSYMRTCYERNYPEAVIKETWKKYWSGSPGSNAQISIPKEYGKAEGDIIAIDDTIWEYIIDGKLELID